MTNVNKDLMNLNNKIDISPYIFNLEITGQASGRYTDVNIFVDYKLVYNQTLYSYSETNHVIEIPGIRENDYLVYIDESGNTILSAYSTTSDNLSNLCPITLEKSLYGHIYYSGCCVPYYALINTPNGNIEAQYINTGDIIYGYDFIENKIIETKVTKSVIDSRDHLVIITLEDNSVIEITDNHTVWTNEGWACLDPEHCDDFGLNKRDNIAIQLNIEQKCLKINNEFKKIIKIEKIPYENNIKVCMFTTESENYFTQNYLVHNLALDVSHNGGSP